MPDKSTNSRLEALCDGVFAIALTILVLDLRAPAADTVRTGDQLWLALREMVPAVGAFLLSFVLIAISWVNHHAIMKAIVRSTPRFVYANVFLLLTIAIIPFPTALLAEFGTTEAAAPAVVAYAFAILMTNAGWILLLQTALMPPSLVHEAARTRLERGLRRGWIGLGLYTSLTALAFLFPRAVAVAISLSWIVWLILGLRAEGESLPHTS
jgi:uncharacterized membrane protein